MPKWFYAFLFALLVAGGIAVFFILRPKPPAGETPVVAVSDPDQTIMPTETVPTQQPIAAPASIEPPPPVPTEPPEGKAAEVSDHQRRLTAGLEVAREDKRHRAVDFDGQYRTTYFNEKKPAGGKFSFRAVSFGESREGYYRDTKISGEVINETGKDVQMATFTITTYDIYNERLSSEAILVSNIAAGESKTFSTVMKEQPYLKVEWYKLQFDSGL